MVFAGGGSIWLTRDLPRRRVERVLGNRLGAKVRVGGLSIRGVESFALRDIEISRVAGQSRLERIRVGSLEAVGPLRGILAGRFENLRLFDVEVRLTPPPVQLVPEGPTQLAEVHVGRLELHRGSIIISAGGSTARLEVEATVGGVGDSLSGEVDVASDSLPLDTIVALASTPGTATPPAKNLAPLVRGSMEGVTAHLALLDGGRRFRARARARQTTILRGDRPVAIAGIDVDATAVREEDGTLSIQIVPSVPFLGTATLAGRVDLAKGNLLSVQGDFRGVDLGTLALLFSPLPPGWIVEGRADLSVHGTEPNTLDYRLTTTLPTIVSPLLDGETTAQNLTVQVEGRARITGADRGGPMKMSFEMTSLVGTVDGHPLPAELLPLRGSFEGTVGRDETPFAKGRFRLDTGLVGGVDASGRIGLAKRGPRAELRWTWSGTTLDRLMEIVRAFDPALPEKIALRGGVAADGTLEGDLGSPTIEGSLAIDGLESEPGSILGESPPSWSLRGGTAKTMFSWHAPAGPIAFRSVEARGTVHLPPLAPFPLAISASGRGDPASGSMVLDRALMESPTLGRARLYGKWHLGGEGDRASAGLHVDGIEPARWRTFLRPLLGDLAPGYEVQGAAEADLSASMHPDGRWTASGKARVAKSGFAAADGSRVVEGLDTSWDLVFAGSASGDDLALQAKASVTGFRVLWGSFYADASKLESQLEAAGEGNLSSSTWKGRASWTYPEGPRLEASLESAPGEPLVYAVQLLAADLGGTLRRYVQAPLAGSVPFLDRLVAGGALRVDLRGRIGNASRSVAGRLELDGLKLEGKEGVVAVNGLDLDLPLDLQWGARGADGVRPLSGSDLRGSLRFARLAAMGLTLPPTETVLEVHADTVGLEEGIAVPLLGGTLVLEKLTLADLALPSRSLESAILLSKIRIEEASKAFGLPTLQGELEGYFPKVRLTPSSFEVEGGGEFSLFGGRLQVGAISGEDILSRYPKLAFSADFAGIDLGQVTRTFDLGEMNGVLDGYVHRCELFRGVPVRFDAQLTTVERPGVSRTINVKAINNIAILGTGAGANVFDRGIQKFFDKYTYERLGIHMSLENDVFLMRGLNTRGDRELFLKGRLPFRIDVVNAQPGKTVSFRTMLERLKTVEFSRATRRK